MAKLYFLPMFEDVYKPYYKHNDDISLYKKTAFERVVMPVFHEGAVQVLQKYEKVGDYQNFGDSRWLRKPFNAKEYYHNVVTLTIDGAPKNVKHMVHCENLSSGDHHIKVEMIAYNYNPREKSGKGLQGTQIAKDYAELDLCVGDGDYYIVATHKTQKGAYVYNSPYNDGNSRIKNTFFEYHSVQASVVSRTAFLSHLKSGIELSNIDVNALKDSTNHTAKSHVEESEKAGNISTATPTKPNVKESVSATSFGNNVSHNQNNYTQPTQIKPQKKLSNDEYFDLLVDSVTTTQKKDNTPPQKQKEKPTPTPIKYVTDKDPLYSELYEDGTLVYKRQSEVYVPRQVTTIDKYFLWKNEYVKKVVLADGITKLVESELRECPNLEEVVLPKNLQEFSYNCIQFCPNLKNVYLDDSNPYFTIIDGALYRKIEDCNLSLILYPPKKDNEHFTAPSNCTIIDAYAFNGNKFLKRADLTSVKYIELSAFSFCSHLEEVSFGKGLTNIRSFGFENTALTKVELPMSTKVGSFAFPEDCKVKKKLFFK